MNRSRLFPPTLAGHAVCSIALPRVRQFPFLVAAPLLLFGPLAAQAAWLPGGTPVTNGLSPQFSTAAQPDGAGGAFIGLIAQVGGNYRPFLKHIGSDGTLDPAYEPNGVQIGNATGPRVKDGPLLDAAPGGGWYVAWQDDSIRVQQVIGTGVAPGWPASGIAVAGAAPNWSLFSNLRLAVDGAGTAHLFWDVSFEQIGGSESSHAAVTAAGAIAASPCSPVCSGDRTGGSVTVAGGQVVRTYNFSGYGSGEPGSNVIVNWSPSCASRSIGDDHSQCIQGNVSRYSSVVVPSDGDNVIIPFGGAGTVQRYSPSGAVTAQWPPESGPAILPAEAFDRSPVGGVSDEAGGALIVYHDGRELVPSWGLTVQAVDATGAVPAGWATDGTYVASAGGYPELGGAVSDGAAGIVLGWSRRTGNDVAIYAQRVGAGGGVDPGWVAGGVPVTTIPGFKYLASVVTDGFGGALLVWSDYDNAPAAQVFAQRISAGGTIAPVVAVSPTGSSSIRLSAGLPNPTRGSASFTLDLPQAAAVGARVVSLSGRKVASLLAGEALPAGANPLRWDGLDDAGRTTPPGIYFLEVTVGDRTLPGRIVRLP